MIYGYIRVSTDKQTVENQRFEIQRYARKNKLVVNEWIEETISGTINPNKRNLGKLLSKTQKMTLLFVQSFHDLGEICL